MNTVRYIKVQQENGDYSTSIPIGADAENITLKNGVDAEQTFGQLKDKAAALTSRVDSFTHLAEGSTTGDAELLDIRNGVDGTKYGSAGTAVRAQVNKITRAKAFVDDDNYLEIKNYRLNNTLDDIDPLILDPTLTISGAAADAKATGDAIREGADNLAPTYSTTATYAVGDYVIYNNQLYKCTTAITTGETWTAAKWVAAKIASDVISLKEDLHESEVGKNTMMLEKMKWLDWDGVKDYLYDKTYNPNMYDATGTPSHHNTLAMSNMVECEPSKTYVVADKFYERFIVSRITFYDNEKKFISSSYTFGRTSDNVCYTFETPSNAYYFRIMSPMTGGEASYHYGIYDYMMIVSSNDYISIPSVPKSNKDLIIDRYENGVGAIKTNIASLEIPVEYSDYETHNGYRYGKSISPSTDGLFELSNACAVKIKVNEGERYLISGKTNADLTTTIRFETYDGYLINNTDYVSEQPLIDYLVTVPKDIAYIRLTFVNVSTYPYSIKKYQIKNDKLPDYWETYLDSKYDEIISAMTDGGMSTVFAFITDTHKPTNPSNYSPKIIKKIDDHVNLSAVVHGGDMVNWYANKQLGLEAITDAIKDYADLYDKLLITEGNHDNTPVIGGLADAETNIILSNKELFSYFYRYNRKGFVFGNNRPWISGTDRHGYNSGALYGYYDDADSKVRYVNLCGYDINYDGWNGNRISQKQLDWLAEVLEDVAQKTDSNEWVVVPFIHHGSNSQSYGLTTNYEYVTGMLNAAKNGTSYIVENGGVTGEPINLNVTFSNEVIVPCILCGHRHTDDMQVIDNVNCIVTTSDAYGNHGGVRGTVTEQAFDIVVINKLSRTIVMKRIGSGNDRTFNY